MGCRFSLPACLVLLYGLIALGAALAEAAGIGVHVRVHAQNIPRAVAEGHNPHVGMGAGAQTASQLNPNTRSIQLDTAGESTNYKLFRRGWNTQTAGYQNTRSLRDGR